MKRTYAVVFERSPNNYAAYAPDIPGCVATARTWDKMQLMIREALAFHFQGLAERGEPIPEPSMSLCEAMAYHSAELSAAGEEDQAVETTFGAVEVEFEALAPASVTSA